MQIILKDVFLYGFHGVHPLEQKVGTRFRINLKIDLDTDHPIQSLSDTLDYAMVFEIVRKEFAKTEALLEVLLDRITSAVSALSSKIKTIDITIEKLNAPISGFQGEVGVRLNKCFK